MRVESWCGLHCRRRRPGVVDSGRRFFGGFRLRGRAVTGRKTRVKVPSGRVSRLHRFRLPLQPVAERASLYLSLGL